MTDLQLELLRDQLAAMAEIMLETNSEKLRSRAANSFHERLRDLPGEQQDDIIERAAIMEIDGGLYRAEAEDKALQSWYRMQLEVKSESVN